MTSDNVTNSGRELGEVVAEPAAADGRQAGQVLGQDVADGGDRQRAARRPQPGGVRAR